MKRISKKGLAASRINVSKRKVRGKVGGVAGCDIDCDCVLDTSCPAKCSSICDPDLPGMTDKINQMGNLVGKLKIKRRKLGKL